ncbi:MAG: glycosyltransferase [Clostridia bacterium]|nr:glycosyltransferase [Clostridia bacterium]
MKILITTDLFTVTTNGVVTSLKNLWREMQKRGHDVKILTFSESKESYKDEEEGVYYIGSKSMEKVYPGIRRPLSYRGELIDEIIAWKPDIIHSQCEFFSYFFAIRIAKKTGAKIVHTYHTMYEDYVGYVIKFSKSFGKFAVKKFSKNRLDKSQWVVAPTSKVKELLVRYKVKPPVSIIPTGISIDQHKERISAEERLEKRTAYGIEQNDVVMVNLGRLGHEKNVDELINYYSKALKSHSNLKFLIVGDGPAREKLEKLTAELGLSGKVIFAGRVAPKEVQRYYQLGDIFVSASTSETQGLTYIEGAANALPLLCRNDPCLDDVIEQGVNGYSYNTEEEFLTFIDKMVSDAEWIANASKRSAEISQKFDKSVFGDSVEAIYKELLK